MKKLITLNIFIFIACVTTIILMLHSCEADRKRNIKQYNEEMQIKFNAYKKITKNKYKLTFNEFKELYYTNKLKWDE